MNDDITSVLGDKTLRLLVIGDLMLDRYVWGDIGRISPEAPVQVLRWREENESLGGAANVANNLAALGCEVRLFGLVGEDAEGERLKTLAKDAGIEGKFIFCDRGFPTTCKTRLIARSQHVIRMDKEGTPKSQGALEEKLIGELRGALDGVDGVICSDYLKGVLPPGLLNAIFAAADARGVSVIIDPKGRDFSKYRGAKALTPNLEEIKQVTGIPVNDEADLDRAAGKIIQDIENEFLLVTRGAEGMTLYGRQGRVTHEKARALDVFDVTGAGDTAVALFGLAYFAGASPEEIARLANLAAGIVVGKVGTSTVSLSELLNADLTGKQGTTSKILDPEDLLSRLRHERAKGRVVVFTNGCFDLPHVGHIQYLQQARQLGDLLVVGLNDDASVYRNKGEGRPLIEEMQRAQLLAALACVDFVAFFCEDTPKNLIERVRPDILVKGGDYETGEVVGRDLVESFGGRVEVLPFIEGISTSDIVGTILERYAPGKEKV